ncbi:putative phage tail assembly chaperone [Marinomonas transparens]|uniref:Uncharacterized protein n=1 Tax=Marinomonas transparens TaxID=2795388 RepID=A0A934MVE9_9GAMM|nr:putative phage tail assembly chaperone [Marinomonas transparens]MBJ7536949.1 hypothetical protein [Marinomonas transparens]
MAQAIAVTIGETDFVFNVTDKGFNKFTDSISTGGKATLAAYSFLSDAVENKQHAALKGLLVNEVNEPRSSLVMDVIKIVQEEFTSELPSVVKTRASSETSSKGTASSNS